MFPNLTHSSRTSSRISLSQSEPDSLRREEGNKANVLNKQKVCSELCLNEKESQKIRGERRGKRKKEREKEREDTL